MTHLLVDGNGLVCKLWWASASDVPDRFAQTVARIAAQFSAERIAVAWDSSSPTWRHDIFPAYKAKRPPKPEALREALRECRCLPQLEHYQADGYEADDVIATLADRVAADEIGGSVLILAEDKDFAQLVSPTCRLVNARGDVVDEAAVERRWGVPPSMIRHLLSWMGDASDGLPGVRGIGPKKAVPLALAGKIGDPMTYELVELAILPADLRVLLDAGELMA